jgi:uncharacterized protein (DUF885 family)
MRPGVFRCALGLVLGLTALRLPAQETFDAFSTRVAADWVRLSPQGATIAQYFTGAEQDALDRELVAFDSFTGLPIEPAVREKVVAQARQVLEQLRRHDVARLTPSQKVSAGVIETSMQRAIDTAPLADHWLVFQQFRGLQVTLVNFLSQSHPIRNRRDIENYLARLEKVAPLLDAGIAQARAQAERGIIAPRFILTTEIAQLDRFLADEPAKNVLVTSLDERIAKLAGLAAADRARFVQHAEQVVREAILPAYTRIRALIGSQVGGATDDAGLWRLPKGREAYAVALKANTTTELTADEIHALGMREVARIEAEMDRLLQELGLRTGSINARFSELNARLQPPAEPDPRPALLAEYSRLMRDAERRAESLFDLRPRAPVTVVREPPFTERTAAARYSQPAPDGSRPGIFWVPLPGPTYNMLLMRTLSYHEAVPGHHFQIALQQELPDIPRFRQLRVFSTGAAFAEGWGLYAEKVAAESGWYEGDRHGLLGQLSSELFRARRLVVDTGLHAKRWTRQQAIDYGISPSEVDRYVVYPGQACSYKIGELEILAQREKARRALGAKFSLKEFHNVLLRTGEVPMNVLSQAIDRYIAEAR